jgi:hypothetical protein
MEPAPTAARQRATHQGNRVNGRWFRLSCHCEERSDAAIPIIVRCPTGSRLLRSARNDKEIRGDGDAFARVPWRDAPPVIVRASWPRFRTHAAGDTPGF